MNKLTQHIPGFADIGPPSIWEFETTEQLLALDWVGSWATSPSFQGYVLSDHHLLALWNEGFEWRTIGFIEDPTAVDLPQWEGWKFYAEFEDGSRAILGPEVVSCCHGDLQLTDGRTAIRLNPAERPEAGWDLQGNQEVTPGSDHKENL